MADQRKFESISKLEAATRQLCQAIRLFFQKEDAISIHTLTSAAHQILIDLTKSQNPNGLKEVVLHKGNPVIKEEMRKRWHDKIHSDQNFFKHAERDPKHIHKFNPERTPFYIWDATLMHGDFSNTEPIEVRIFRYWFGLTFPDLFGDGLFKRTLNNFRISGMEPNDFETICEIIKTRSCRTR